MESKNKPNSQKKRSDMWLPEEGVRRLGERGTEGRYILPVTR